jgi:hypothetical protein
MNRISEETETDFNSDHKIRIFGDKVNIKWTQNVYICGDTLQAGFCTSNGLELGLRRGTRLQTHVDFSTILRQGSAVGIVTACGLDDRGIGFRAPKGSRIFSFPYCPDRL